MKRMQDWESLVLTGTEWSRLRYREIEPGSLQMFTIQLDGSGYREFECGKDFEIDFREGKLRRTPASQIGDYRNSPFFGCDVFNHEPYNGNWGNYPFTVYVRYIYNDEANTLTEDIAKQITVKGGLPLVKDMAVYQKLLRGEEITYTVIGDSISTGCEAIEKRHAYFSRFADKLERVTGGKIQIVNKAIGGENSAKGATHFIADLEDSNPDFITIAYGINDMCVHGEDREGPSEISIREFHDHLAFMIENARKRNAEVILVTDAIPNPAWKFTSKKEYEFPEETRRLAREYGVPLADNRKLWESELEHGKTLHDLLLNDVNHPTTYGHGLYAQMLFSLI